MRLTHALKTDIYFQFKQGFYVVYVVLTLFYMVALSWIPENALPIVVPIVIFSDPSVLGLFFIGGIIMLEKSQGIINAIVITPLRIREYLLSKVLSLGILSVLASIAITIVNYPKQVNWFLLLPSIMMTSIFFTLIGVLITTCCQTVNEFLVKMVPYMLILLLPCFSIIGFKYTWLLTPIPSVIALRLCIDAFTSTDLFFSITGLLYLAIINTVLFKKTVRVFENKIVYGG